MTTQVLHALIAVSNWGEKNELEYLMTHSQHAVSVFHMMGKSSYLIDANFDSKLQLEEWISVMKGLKLASGVPSITSLTTQKIIDVHKQKGQFDLTDYRGAGAASHFFMYVDVAGSGDDLISYLKNNELVQSVVHIQGEHSFAVEVIAENYYKYKEALGMIKALRSVSRVVTQEVIRVIKYRNQILDESGSLAYPREDIREMFTL